MTHNLDTVKGSHKNFPATATHNGPRFSSGRYLEELMAELDRAAISARLKQSREEAGLLQREIADVFQVHVNTIQNWENPRLDVPWGKLEAWAELTRTTKLWLLQGDAGTTTPDDLERLRLEVAELQEKVDELLARIPKRRRA